VGIREPDAAVVASRSGNDFDVNRRDLFAG
jgi:hypothetical protein